VIDLHSHILWGLDDGARTLDDSLEMARMAAAAGTTDIVASPHSNNEYRFDPELVESRIAELQAAAGDSIRIHFGCDFHLTMENVEAALAAPDRFSIAHRGYLLVEFADFVIPRTTPEIFRRLLGAGMRPIVTHPERNPLLVKRIPELAQWVNLGCLMQVTAASLDGRFGREAKATAETMMRQGLVHVLASDAHDAKHRPPVLDGAWELVNKEYGAETARLLLEENPRAILAGVALPAGPMAVAKKKMKWFRL
jgi:protein-tyrosine phosphatase